VNPKILPETNPNQKKCKTVEWHLKLLTNLKF
jgi:hypothetical protein